GRLAIDRDRKRIVGAVDDRGGGQWVRRRDGPLFGGLGNVHLIGGGRALGFDAARDELDAVVRGHAVQGEQATHVGERDPVQPTGQGVVQFARVHVQLALVVGGNSQGAQAVQQGIHAAHHVTDGPAHAVLDRRGRTVPQQYAGRLCLRIVAGLFVDVRDHVVV